MDSVHSISEEIDCSGFHNSETYKVADWNSDQNPWDITDEEIQKVAESVCMPWDIPESSTLNYWFFYIPTKEDWNKGARWIRCDAASKYEDKSGKTIFATWEGLIADKKPNNNLSATGIADVIIQNSGYEWVRDLDYEKFFDGEFKAYMIVDPYGECEIYIFQDQVTAERLTNRISFSSNAYDAWIGESKTTGEGVIVKVSGGDSPCAEKIREILNWEPLDTKAINYLPAGNPFELCLYSSQRVYGGPFDDAIAACKYQFERDGKEIPEGY
jgi:hypothetical protein